MEIRFLLALIALLGGIWIYLFNVVLRVTATEPAEYALVLLGHADFVVLVYLALGLCALYRAGLKAASLSTENDAPATTGDLILFGTWPVAIISLGVSFLVIKLPIPEAWQISGVSFAITGLTFIGWVCFFAKSEWAKALSDKMEAATGIFYRNARRITPSFGCDEHRLCRCSDND